MSESAILTHLARLRALSWPAGPRVHFAGISLLSLIILILYHPAQQPIFGDRAYFTYMAQTVFRGEPLYQTTTLGYAPVGIFLSAGAMHVGGWLGLPTYLAPRFLGLFVAALSGGLLTLVTRRATRSAWAGIMAGLALVHVDFFTVLTVSNLEPKILVQFFTLVAVAAIQKRRWGLAAFAAALAAMTWQAAAVVVIAVFIVCLGNVRRQGRSILAHFGAGFLLGLLPVLVYLSLTRQWIDFVQQAILFKLMQRAHLMPERSLQTLRTFLSLLRAVGLKNAPILMVAPFGFVASAVRMGKRGPQSMALFCFHPRLGGLVPLTVLSLTYWVGSGLARVEYQGAMDVTSFLYLIIFWAAYGWLLVTRRVGRHLRSRMDETLSSGTLLAVVALLIGLSAVSNVFQYDVPYTLAQQRALVESAVSDPAPDRPFLAVNTVDFYVLAEQPSPWRTLYVTPYFLDFINRQEAKGCRSLLQDVQRQYRAVVVAVKENWENECLERLLARLRQDGHYRQRTVDPDTPQPCGTSDLIGNLLRAGNTGRIDVGAWWKCLVERLRAPYRMSGAKEIVVFRR